MLSAWSDAVTLPRPRVLIVDDNRDAADALAALVRLWGYECYCVYEPMHAFEVALVRQPDVVLTDIAMPSVNGFALAKMIRNHPGMRQPMLVAISAHGDEDHREEAVVAGFDHYLVKPAKPTDVESLLASLEVHA